MPRPGGVGFAPYPHFLLEVRSIQFFDFFGDCTEMFNGTFAAMWNADTDFFRVLFTAIVMFMIFAFILYLMNHTKK